MVLSTLSEVIYVFFNFKSKHDQDRSEWRVGYQWFVPVQHTLKSFVTIPLGDFNQTSSLWRHDIAC